MNSHTPDNAVQEGLLQSTPGRVLSDLHVLVPVVGGTQAPVPPVSGRARMARQQPVGAQITER